MGFLNLRDTVPYPSNENENENENMPYFQRAPEFRDPNEQQPHREELIQLKEPNSFVTRKRKVFNNYVSSKIEKEKQKSFLKQKETEQTFQKTEKTFQEREKSFHEREKSTFQQKEKSAVEEKITKTKQLPDIEVPETQKDLKIYIDAILNTSNWSVRNLNIKPGDPGFLIWFIFDSYFPLFSACAGPLSIMLSVCSIVCAWKEDKITGDFVKDDNWLYIINSVTILFAGLSNISLLLNFRKRIRYTFSQVISICGWGVACFIMVAVIIGFHVDYMSKELYLKYRLSYGFWFACFAVVIHFSNFSLLFLNDLGFQLKKYKPVFNIDDVQKLLMVQCIFTSFWLVVGAACTSKAFNLNFGEALYYCVNGMVTVGAQQYVPNDHGSRVLSLLWVIVSLISFGLVAYTINEMVIGFSASTLYWNKVNKARLLKFAELKSNRDDREEEISSRDAFLRIKSEGGKALLIQKMSLLGCILLTFAGTLLCGALFFCFVEHWDYNFSVYFCFECLITLGDGKLEPKSPAGKSFFCIWALFAVPVMTMLISSLTDVVFYAVTHMRTLGFVDMIVYIAEELNWCGIFDLLIKVLTKKVDLDEEQRKMLASNEAELLNIRDSYLEQIKEYADVDRLLEITSDPLENIAHAIITTDKIDDLSFLYNDHITRSLKVKTNLAGYYKEGKIVDDVSKELVRRRREFILKILQEVDKDFDTSPFQTQNLHIGTSDEKSYLTQETLSVLNTKFRKKNDFILNNLSELQVLIIELEKAMLLSEVDAPHKYSFEEWTRFLTLTQNKDYFEDPVGFWLSDSSPFSFPNYEPRYFSHHYLHNIDLKIQKLAIEYDMLQTKAIPNGTLGLGGDPENELL